MADKQVYRLKGLSCTNCAANFEKNLRQIESIQEAEVNFSAAKLTIFGDATIEQLEQAGAFDHIKVYAHNQGTPRIPVYKKRENLLTLSSLLLIIVGYSFYFQLGENHVATVGAFLLSIIVGGYDLIRAGIKNIAKLQFDMKTLMTIAIIGAAIIGEWAEAAVIVFLFALSEALEGYSMDKARNSIKSLMEIAPNDATIKRGKQLVQISVEDVRIGDTMIVKPGEKIPMDGIVREGRSFVNQAAITGESAPVEKKVKSTVYAGTVNEEGALVVEVTKLSEDSTIAKIIHLVEEAQTKKAPTQAFVDRFAKYYTPAIMLIALMVMVIPPLLGGEWQTWMYNGLAVLVVGCPCALVISTPVAIVTAIGNAARNGVLIKGGIHLEQLATINTIAFDKTGTITVGKPVVVEVNAIHGTKEELIQLAGSLERYSEHPIARAILKKAHDVSLLEATQFQSYTGKGIVAFIDGVCYKVGNAKLFEGYDLPIVSGGTVVYVGSDEQILGYIKVADQPRKGIKQHVQKLYQLGIVKTVMLTGDVENVAKQIGEESGITEVKAELFPEEKLSHIKRVKERYRVAMVGDGINDAPALAEAHVGIAMGGAGTDVALETADIALMGDDVSKLADTISLSKRTLRIIKENIILALSLKVVALLLVIPGWLTLWLAIFADMGATLLVVANALRLMRKTAEIDSHSRDHHEIT
ncbi:heavy metal translocating P-type ATPase [Gracilibacillus sp. S3-1-1]|uniref:Heavy metal translocating P-type ATPase n=1 Tax=Gracilibacillus pellucidus TaxID=3095368 RepID=A0ACC6M192_9BACI|nr:heavy metal translocating P-type ATPase [Gracilibacillus sp. S3-1-1]MDX8044502.1 heavy metal translocating P-type ATPase [Gracilibacillus sp. S3-1-1]